MHEAARLRDEDLNPRPGRVRPGAGPLPGIGSPAGAPRPGRALGRLLRGTRLAVGVAVSVRPSSWLSPNASDTLNPTSHDKGFRGTPMNKRTVVIIAPDNVTLQDVVGPWEVFCRAEMFAPGAYDVVVASTGPEKQVRTKFGLPIVCQASIHGLDRSLDTVLVAGSDEVFRGPVDSAFLDWLRDASTRVRRLGSICTGAFYLGHAGLLSGRRVTTHWKYLKRLGDTFPGVTVAPDPIFVKDGALYTSAGISAGIDLALALVEEDRGPSVSQAIARDLVLFVQRQADQSQLSTALAQRMADRDPIRHLQRWAPDHLQAISTVEDMAAFVNMSPRHFARLFKAQTGITPGAYIRQLRVEAARRRLQETTGVRDSVAAQVGFGSTRTLRRSLKGRVRAGPA